MKEATSAMSDEEFKTELTLFGGYVELADQNRSDW
jgi:hypothetical protein